MTFSEFIVPHQKTNFFERYYEKKPLLIKRNQSDFYSDLFQINDIEECLLSKDLNFKDLKVLVDNKSISPSNYSNSTNSGIDSRKLQDFKDKGALIILNSINRYIKKISDFFTPIVTELNTSFQCNCYLSPKNSKGFNVHFDTHDVFALQVYGKKTWEIYEFEEYLPCLIPNTSLQFTPENNLKPLMKIELEEGDLLYLPRGFYHKAYTTTHPSAHIAINYSLIFGYKLVSALGNEFHVNNFFRKTYPSDGFEKDTYIQKFKQELISSIQNLTLSDFDKLYQYRLDEVKQRNKFQSTVNINSTLCRLNISDYSIQNDKLTCTLKCNNSTIVLPINFNLAITEIMNKPQISVNSIPLKEEKHRVQLAKKLVIEGVFSLKD